MQRNRVFINKAGLVEIQVVGDQTVGSVKNMADQALVLCQAQRMAGKPALILDNLQEIGSVPAETRKLVVELVKSTEYDRLAMLGSDTLIRLGANLMLQATGKGKRVKYFDDRTKCVTWLLRSTLEH